MAKKKEELVEEEGIAEDKPKGETRKLEPDAEAPKPRKRRAETKVLPPDPEMVLELSFRPLTGIWGLRTSEQVVDLLAFH